MEPAWRTIAAAGEVAALRKEAARFGLRALLGRSVRRLPADALTPEARLLVAEGLAAEAASGRGLGLATRLLESPELAGTRPVAVKGAGLVALGLAGPEREMVDADVLVDVGSLGAWRDAADRIGASWREGDLEAYEMAYVHLRGAIVELHAALAGPAGNSRGPGYAEVVGTSVEVRGRGESSGLRALTGQPAREAAVHHFAYHHAGDPVHALRALQDVACLEGTGEGEGLRWPGPSPAGAVATLRSLVREVRSRGDARGPEAGRFVERLAAVIRHESRPDGFSGEVDRWIEHARATGEGRTRLVLRRLFAGRQLARPLKLGTRYLRSVLERVAHPRRERDVGSWRRYLKGDVR